MEYSYDGKTPIEMKGNLAPGIYERRDGRLFKLETSGEVKADAAMDRLSAALERLNELARN